MGNEHRPRVFSIDEIPHVVAVEIPGFQLSEKGDIAVTPSKVEIAPAGIVGIGSASRLITVELEFDTVLSLHIAGHLEIVGARRRTAGHAFQAHEIVGYDAALFRADDPEAGIMDDVYEVTPLDLA